MLGVITDLARAKRSNCRLRNLAIYAVCFNGIIAEISTSLTDLVVILNEDRFIDTAKIDRTIVHSTSSTLYPGAIPRYGWTNDIHIIFHANGTLCIGGTQHIGQAFFDQDLITTVEETSPYNTKTIEVKENADDYTFGDDL
ncbi:uncharacterized protein BT62DRAFT_1008493 [Guyanagaster necrorhizus]|uniref:Uncharacterized protein n=1 Tax=Guyanagaster necrorhizus TaxID=856835 RepID=A0A9P7VMA7_9AGAR|nr:uncharacterized protein BT62DRAFT_1008493 [Guyanagaster necrorhizus MCA 3950]KAG7443836.1 hypothetical protein BT62DRAFT_1008493 [Guyanagaster necrorhizus MCA 3950]